MIEAKSIVGLERSPIWEAIDIIIKAAVLKGDKVCKALLLQPEQENGSTPLHVACSLGNIEVVVGLYNTIK